MAHTMFEKAQRYVGIKEIAGDEDHPLIQWWLMTCGFGRKTRDEIPWCSAFLNGICYDEPGVPRSKSAMARSWLHVGTPVLLEQATVGNDIVIFNRGGSPDPSVLNSPGHVGLYAGRDRHGGILVLGGNQDNGVGIKSYSAAALLGVRRLTAY